MRQEEEEEEEEEEEDFASSTCLATRILVEKGGQWLRKIRTRVDFVEHTLPFVADLLACLEKVTGFFHLRLPG